MMTLLDWFKRYHERPLWAVTIFLFGVWFIFASRSLYTIELKQRAYVDQMADLLSLALYQKNRVFAESLLQTLLSQGGASSAQICDGAVQLIGLNASQTGCQEKHRSYERVVSRSLQGSGNFKLRAKFNLLAAFIPVLSGLSFGLIFVLFGFYIIRVARDRLKTDLFDPLLKNLMGVDHLKIRELADLRQTIETAKSLEAQRAVTLAIQDNNQQVAHDIRGPIQAMNALLKMTDISDSNLRMAIDKSLHRINVVANELLKLEGKDELRAAIFEFDVSTVVQDIVAEKSTLFVNGHITIESSGNIFVRSKISPDALSRILSNIIDNSIAACSQHGAVGIQYERSGDMVDISVQDYGCGIPDHILARVGEKGFTQRESGSGRGVYSAKKALESAGGGLSLTSKLGEGTKVTLRLPVASAEVINRADFVLIDNEEIHRLTWGIWAKRKGYCIRTFESVRDFLVLAPVISRSTAIFMDFNLGENETADKYLPDLSNMGFVNIYFVTSHEGLKTESFLNLKGISGKDPELAEPFLFCKSPNNLDFTTAEIV